MAEMQKKSISDYKLPGARRPMNRGAETEKAKDSKGTFMRMLRYFTCEKRAICLLLLMVLLGVVCGILAPRLQSSAIDAITQRNFGQLPRLLCCMAIIYAVSCLAAYLQGRESALISQRTVKQMRKDLFSHIINLPVGYLDTHSHGDIMSRMTNDVENVSTTISQSLSSLFSGLLTVCGTVMMMFLLCPPLAALSCSTVLFTVFATKYLSAAMRKTYAKRQALLGSLNGTVEEMVGGYRTVVAYEKEQLIIDDFTKISDELTGAGIRAEILGGSMGPVMNLINNTGFVIIAAFGGYFAFKGAISVGIISAFIVYAKQFGRPIDEIAQVWGQVQSALAGAERVFAVMNEAPEDKSGRKKISDLPPQPDISFAHVSFSYVPGQRVLTDFSLHVRPGQKIALVGATGSGKTTVVNLLMRFYRPDSGTIRVGGTDIMDISSDSLRDAIAIVLQDTVLFADTVRNNLKYADPDISDEEMIACARQCHVDSTIRRLENGYDTLLSADASNISRGQQQLLSIARAFISKPQILILDEATSNVDTRTERRIQDAMMRLMQDRTCLVIAHRLSTIRDADLIVVLDHGAIAETGTHEELLQQNGKYHELYMTQFAGQAT
ncbi:MAG: ABC transporter ATP-binding protein [Lachnospiraceae bacterium]|nr:ABC transporter ATP-binding protein [Lachnospiraceae bacterium]